MEPTDDPTQLDSLARRQRGLVTSADLGALGYKAHQIEHRLAVGRLFAVRRGVYRVAGAPVNWEQCLHAAVLAAPPGSAASHRSAARLLALRGIDADVLEISSPRPCRLAGVQVHRSRVLPAADICRRVGMDCTTASRTLCDLSGGVPIAILGRALDECLRNGQATLAGVERCRQRLWASHGRRRLAPISELVAARRDGPALGDTPLETKVLAWLREAGLPDPETQLRVKIGRRAPYRFDLGYRDLRIGIDVHGWYEHGKQSAFQPDLTRRNHLASARWLILEFTDSHSRTEVVSTVRSARDSQTAALAELARLLATGTD